MFFSYRQAARACCREHLRTLYAARLLSFGLALGVLLSLGGALAMLFPERLPLSLPPWARGVLFVLLTGAAALYGLFACGGRLFAAACFLRLTGADTARPSEFLCAAQALRALRAVLLVGLYRFLWAAFSFLPAAGVGLTFHRHMQAGQAENVLTALLLGTAALTLAGLFFYILTVRRYALTAVLLVRFPAMPVAEAILRAANQRLASSY